MFETVIAAMLKRKQIVFAAIAVTALVGYVMPPTVQVAQATSFGGDLASDIIGGVFGTDEDNAAVEEEDDDDGVDQDITQDLAQDQEASNEIDQDNEQSQTNVQANDLETGDNTATNTAVTENEQDVTAVSGDASAAAEGGDSEVKEKKHSKCDSCSDGSTSSSADAAAEAISAATATGSQDNDATATSTQDSSIHDVTFDNEANFAPQTNDQVAVALNDQDQRAANLAAQLGIDLDITSSFTGTGFTNTD